MLQNRFTLLTIIIALLMLGCDAQAQSDPIETSIVYGLTLEPSGIDPHRNQSAELGIVLRQVYDTLVYRHPETAEFAPGLAQSWTISEDSLNYTFELRQDVSFHDGTPFNAQAVGANLDRIINPDTASQRAVFMLGPYAGYTILDTYTIQITLTQPYAPLLDSLSQVYLGMASPTAFSEVSVNRYQFHQVGTGPYRFIEYTPGDDIVIQRNPDYTWGPEFYDADSTDAPDEIVYRFFSDPATRALALESGEAQVMGELLPSDARALTGNSQIQLLPTPIPGQPLHFLFNTQQYPTDSLVVRQALIHATNRTAIVESVYQGLSPVAWGPLSSTSLFYNGAVIGRYDYDVQQAQALLASVSLTDEDGNGFIDAGGEDLTITMIVPPWGLIPQTAQLIQDQWREIGINLVLRQVPNFGGLLEAASNGEYNLIAFNSFGYDPAFIDTFYETGGANNFSNYSNPELDSAFDIAEKEVNLGIRRQIYENIQVFIMDEALILPIRDYINLNATTLDVQNLQYDLYGWFPIMTNVSVVTG